MYNQKLRPRRMRITPAMRAMVRETTLSAKDFVYPIFVVPGEHVKEEIPSMPNCYHLSVDNAAEVKTTVDAAARSAFNGGQSVAVLLRQKLIGIKNFGKK